MPQYICAVNKSHTQYLAAPDSLYCCGKPMLLKQSAPPQQPAAPTAQPASAASAVPPKKTKKWRHFWQ